MSKPKLPPGFQRNYALELFRVLQTLSAFAKGISVDDPEAGDTAAMILLSRLGLAAPLSDDEDDEDIGSWILTVEGNEKLAGLMIELRQWDLDRPAKAARRRKMKEREASLEEGDS